MKMTFIHLIINTSHKDRDGVTLFCACGGPFTAVGFHYLPFNSMSLRNVSYQETLALTVTRTNESNGGL